MTSNDGITVHVFISGYQEWHFMCHDYFNIVHYCWDYLGIALHMGSWCCLFTIWPIVSDAMSFSVISWSNSCKMLVLWYSKVQDTCSIKFNFCTVQIFSAIDVIIQKSYNPVHALAIFGNAHYLRHKYHIFFDDEAFFSHCCMKQAWSKD